MSIPSSPFYSPLGASNPNNTFPRIDELLDPETAAAEVKAGQARRQAELKAEFEKAREARAAQERAEKEQRSRQARASAGARVPSQQTSMANPQTGQGHTSLTVSATELSEAVQWLIQNNLAITEENLANHIMKRRQISDLLKTAFLLKLKAVLDERQR